MKLSAIIISFLLFIGLVFMITKALKNTNDISSSQTSQTAEETAKDAVQGIQNNPQSEEDPTLAP
jgi:sortase (surface protein transpeptidase)